MAKEFISNITLRSPRPRSKRLRAMGIATMAASSVIASTASTGDGHYHANKNVLDALADCADGYVRLSLGVEKNGNVEVVTEKAKAGYADTAAYAALAYDLTDDSPTVKLIKGFSSNFIPMVKTGDSISESSWAAINDGAPLFAVKSVKGFYSEEFLAARGLNPFEGEPVTGGLDETQLADYLAAHQYARLSDIPSLSGYAKLSDIPSLSDYAKKSDIPSLSDYAKKSEIPSLAGYATEDWVTGKGYATQSWVEGKGYALTSALSAHTGDSAIHITGAERTAWNGKLDASVYNSFKGGYDTWKTSVDAFIAEFDSMFEKESDSSQPKKFRIKALFGLYTDEFLSARGLNSDGGGAGGGLIGNVYGSKDLGKAFADTTLTDTFNAYTINAIHSRVASLESGSALSLSTTGSGNAVTAISKSGTTITATKGATFLTGITKAMVEGVLTGDISSHTHGQYLTSHQDISGKVDKVNGKGLSSNDFTDALLTKLNGIEEGANKYTHPTATATTIAAASGKVLSAITVNGLGHVTSVSSKTIADTDIPNLDWSKISSGKPTTLSGYGITDAYTKTEADGRYVNVVGDTMTGNLTVPRVNIVGSASSTAYLTSDSVANVYFNIGGRTPFVINNTESSVRPGAAYPNVFTLGTTSYRWRDVCSVLGNFSGLITASGGIKIGDVTITYDSAAKGLKVSGGGLYSDSFISARGLNSNGSGSGGGTAYNRLDNWSDYATGKEGYVVSAKLGWDLYQNKLNATKAAIEGLLTGTITSHTHSQYFVAYGTSNDNIDSDWGQSVKTFDPIPSGTPPEQNANITLLSLGNNSIRRKMLAFTYNNDNIYYRRNNSGTFSAWVKLIHSGNIGSYAITSHQSLANYVTLNGAQTITGVKTFTADINMSGSGSLGNKIYWGRNTDYAQIFFKNDSDADADSYLGFKTGDNNNEYFRFSHLTGGTESVWATIKSGGITANAFIKSGGTSSQFLKADGSVDSNSYLTTGSASSTYVKKAGDTMTGKLTINTTERQTLLLKGSSVGNYVSFGNGDTVGGHVGRSSDFVFLQNSNATNSPYVKLPDSGGLQFVVGAQTNTIWHSGNDGSGSGLDADLLDGLHAASFPRVIQGATSTTGTKYVLLGNLPASTSSTYDSFNIRGTIGGYGSIYKHVVDIEVSNRDGVNFRGFMSGKDAISWDIGVNNAKQVYLIIKTQYCAYNLTIHCQQSGINFSTSTTPTDTNFVLLSASTAVNVFNNGSFSGNATSATKLQTARTIWGQSFDGTGNVSGDMKSVGTIYCQGTQGSFREGLRIKSYNNWSTILFGGMDLTADSGTSEKSWAICNNDGTFYINKNKSNEANSARLMGTSTGWTFGNTSTNAYALNAASFICDSWVRTKGATGWYSETYGGGWYMSDSTWIRNYGNKSLYMNTATIRTDGQLQVGADGAKFLVNSAGNVGIGTTAPAYKLDVKGMARISSDIIMNGGDYPWYFFADGSYLNFQYTDPDALSEDVFWLDGNNGNAWLYGSLTTPKYFLRSAITGYGWNTGAGALSVAVTNNSSQTPLLLAYRTGKDAGAVTGLDRLFAIELLNTGASCNINLGSETFLQLNKGNGQVYVAKYLNCANSVYVTGTIHAVGGTWSDGYVSARGQNTSSDARLKRLIRPFELDLRRIAFAPSVEFEWKSDGMRDLGSVAQYWRDVDARLTPENADGFLTLQYGKTALLASITIARRVMSHEERIEALERSNETLLRENEELKLKLEIMERR